MNDVQNSSSINEIIKTVSCFLYFFFHNKILQAQKTQKRIPGTKGTKRHIKHKNATKQKHKTQISEQK